MEIIQPIADLLGISPMLLIVLSVLFVFLVGVWYVLKFVLKMAWKIMAPGCALIALVLLGLYIFGVLITP